MVERFTILLDFEVSKLLRRFWTESNWIKSLGVLLAYMDSLDWLNMCVCSVCMMMLFVRSSIIFEAFSFIADSLLLAFYPCDCLIGDFYLLSFLEVLDDFLSIIEDNPLCWYLFAILAYFIYCAPSCNY